MISLLIIGNEILSNQVQDHNLKVMLQALNAAYYQIDEVRIVRDEVLAISAAVRELSGRSQFVISTGGVGPTHDDITFLSYAHAFGVELCINAELEARLQSWMGESPKKESLLRMVRLPANAELIDLGPHSWPLVKVANCFVLPGLPEVFDKKFQALLRVLPQAPRRFAAEVYTSSTETDFAAQLTELQETFPDLEIGSYPTYDRTEYAAMVTLKGLDPETLLAAYTQLTQLFSGMGSLVRAKAPR